MYISGRTVAFEKERACELRKDKTHSFYILISFVKPEHFFSPARVNSAVVTFLCSLDVV